jgi:signal transduction histidine kinase
MTGDQGTAPAGEGAVPPAAAQAWGPLAAVPASVHSTSMPAEQVIEPVQVSEASLDAQLLALFFDRAPMGVAVFGTDMRLQRCNKTWTAFYAHYMNAPADYTAPGRHVFDLMPGNEDNIVPLFEAALAGRVLRQAAHRIAVDDLETYWDVVFAPLFADGEVVGVVDIVTDATDRVLAFRSLENRISAFTHIAAGMTVDQPLEATLREVIAAVKRTTAAVACSIVSWADPEVGGPVAYVDETLGDGYDEAVSAVWQQRRAEVAAAGELPRLKVLRGFRRDALADARYAALHELWRDGDWDDLVVVPLTSQSHGFGELHVYLPAGHHLGEDDEAYLTALADQAAVAVQNATLFGAASQHATLLERQRLSRELHDSVSQALFSMTLHARAAERHFAAAGLAADSPAAAEVAKLRELTAGALAEMRALIFELRPGALADEGFAAALSKQAAAMAAREQIPVEVTAPAERVTLTPAVEEHLYRLALEALHNALKHADATHLRVTIAADDSSVTVVVDDNGVGFDPTVPHPGHLGLETMRDRAAACGGTLRIDSAPTMGTRVTVVVPTA